MVKLDLVADTLLAQHDSLGKDAGCYTDRQITRQRERRGECSYDDDIAPLIRPRCLEGIEWPSMRQYLRRGDCPPRAMECLRLALLDYTHREIAALPKIAVHQTTVTRDIQLALHILLRDGTIGMIEVLCEVFGLSPGAVSDILQRHSGS